MSESKTAFGTQSNAYTVYRAFEPGWRRNHTQSRPTPGVYATYSRFDERTGTHSSWLNSAVSTALTLRSGSGSRSRGRPRRPGHAARGA